MGISSWISCRPGVSATVVAREHAQSVPAGVLHWCVEDTLVAYQQLALLHRRIGVPLIGYGFRREDHDPGTDPCTLAPLGSICASEGNNNNDVGVPLTVLGATSADAALVIEMGIRGPGRSPPVALL